MFASFKYMILLMLPPLWPALLYNRPIIGAAFNSTCNGAEDYLERQRQQHCRVMLTSGRLGSPGCDRGCASMRACLPLPLPQCMPEPHRPIPLLRLTARAHQPRKISGASLGAPRASRPLDLKSNGHLQMRWTRFAIPNF